MNYAMENELVASNLLQLSTLNDNNDPSIIDNLNPPPSSSGEFPSFSGSTDSFTARSPDLSSSGEVFTHLPAHSVSLYAFNSGSDSTNASPMLSANRRPSASSSSSSISLRRSGSVDVPHHLPSWNWSYYYYKENNNAESTKRVVVDEGMVEYTYLPRI